MFSQIVEKTSIQAFLALVFSMAVVVGFFQGRIDANAMMQLASVAVGFYFAGQAAFNAVEKALRNK